LRKRSQGPPFFLCDPTISLQAARGAVLIVTKKVTQEQRSKAGELGSEERASLLEELGLRGLHVEAQAPFAVAYKGKHVGTYAADLVVEHRLLVEVKCVDQFDRAPGAVRQILKSFWAALGLADQLPPTQSRMAPSGARSLIRVYARAFAAHTRSFSGTRSVRAPAASFKSASRKSDGLTVIDMFQPGYLTNK